MAYNPTVFTTKDPTDEPWFGEGLSFSCTQCGNCCTGPSGFVWFDEAEGRAMSAELGIDVAEFYHRYARRALGRWTLGDVRNGRDFDCVFLRQTEDGRRMCSVYTSRPTQCRTWPFWPINMKSRRSWEESARTCPGMRKPDERGQNFVPIEQIRVIMSENPKHL